MRWVLLNDAIIEMLNNLVSDCDMVSSLTAIPWRQVKHTAFTIYILIKMNNFPTFIFNEWEVSLNIKLQPVIFNLKEHIYYFFCFLVLVIVNICGFTIYFH